jgi:hypothetical protein
MGKSEHAKIKDAQKKSDKYKEMNAAQKKELQNQISWRRSLRRQRAKAARLELKRELQEAEAATKAAAKAAKAAEKAAEKAAAQAAKVAKAAAKAAAKAEAKALENATKSAIKLLSNRLLTPKDRNMMKCRNWRSNKQASTAIINEAILRRSQRTKNATNYNESIRIEEVFIPGMGNGVRALVDIGPANLICEYGGIKFTGKALLRKKLAAGNDKILTVRDKDMWWDGQNSATLGPKLNHACSCVSNCEITWDGDVPLICSKASLQGLIKKGDYLTLDYGYALEDENLEQDPNLAWYVQYLKSHVCKTDN